MRYRQPFTQRAGIGRVGSQPPIDWWSPELWQIASGVSFVIAYWLTFGSSLGQTLHLTVLIALHELGHSLVLRYYRIDHRGPFWVPGLGALVVPMDVMSKEETGWMVLGGPLLGTILGLVYVAILFIIGSQAAFSVLLMTLLLNGVNLLPLMPLDGGRLLRNALGRLNRELVVAVIFISAAAVLAVAWELTQRLGLPWTGFYFLCGFAVLGLVNTAFGPEPTPIRHEGTRLETWGGKLSQLQHSLITLGLGLTLASIEFFALYVLLTG